MTVTYPDSRPYVPSAFTIDDEIVFPGFHNGQTWNGFACPFFTRDTCDQILKAFAGVDGKDMLWKYSEDGNTLLVWYPEHITADNEPMVFEAITIEVANAGIELTGFELGAFYWIWSIPEVNDADYNWSPEPKVVSEPLPGFRAGNFSIDGGTVYPGYTDGQMWNGGTSRPHFTREVCEQIFQNAGLEDGLLERFYSHDGQSLVFWLPEDPDNTENPSRVALTSVMVDGVEVKVFDLGSCGWSWDEMTAEDVEAQDASV